MFYVSKLGDSKGRILRGRESLLGAGDATSPLPSPLRRGEGAGKTKQSREVLLYLSLAKLRRRLVVGVRDGFLGRHRTGLQGDWYGIIEQPLLEDVHTSQGRAVKCTVRVGEGRDCVQQFAVLRVPGGVGDGTAGQHGVGVTTIDDRFVAFHRFDGRHPRAWQGTVLEN
jgi:hypothetical protein